MGDLIDRDIAINSILCFEEQSKEPDDYYYGGLEDAIAVIKEVPAVETRKWISIKDRLPCEYGNYLAIVSGEVMECSYSGCNTGSNSAWSTCDAYGFKFIPETEITHWMLLPEPPKEDE